MRTYNEFIYTIDGQKKEEAKYQERMIILWTLMKEINDTYPNDYDLKMNEHLYIEYSIKAIV